VPNSIYFVTDNAPRTRMYNNNTVAFNCVCHFIQHSQYVLTDGNVFFPMSIFGARLIFKTASLLVPTLQCCRCSSSPLFIFIIFFYFLLLLFVRSYLFQRDARALLNPLRKRSRYLLYSIVVLQQYYYNTVVYDYVVVYSITSTRSFIGVCESSEILIIFQKKKLFIFIYVCTFILINS